MSYLLPIPSWHGLHPLIIHFPIALLLVAPLFVIVGALLPPAKGRAFLVSALVLMFFGTSAILLAVETGQSAAKRVSLTPAIWAVIAQHRNLALTTAVLFSALTVAFAALLFVPQLLHRELHPGIHAELLAVLLLLYVTGALFLVNTAHQGARLVHEFGLAAPVAATAQESAQIE